MPTFAPNWYRNPRTSIDVWYAPINGGLHVNGRLLMDDGNDIPLQPMQYTLPLRTKAHWRKQTTDKVRDCGRRLRWRRWWSLRPLLWSRFREKIVNVEDNVVHVLITPIFFFCVCCCNFCLLECATEESTCLPTISRSKKDDEEGKRMEVWRGGRKNGYRTLLQSAWFQANFTMFNPVV